MRTNAEENTYHVCVNGHIRRFNRPCTVTTAVWCETGEGPRAAGHESEASCMCIIYRQKCVFPDIMDQGLTQVNLV